VLLERTLRNARFNGLLFLGSLVIFHYGLMPLVVTAQAQLWDAVSTLRPTTVPPPAWSLGETQAVTARLLTAVFYVRAVTRTHARLVPTHVGRRGCGCTRATS
jgi:hypothetical protein